MPHHHERQLLPYRRDQMFSLVADVERYPEFLPWCRAARILERHSDHFVAELVIGFKGIRESYTSNVELRAPGEIDVTMIHGPFKHLTNRWRFNDIAEGCEILFDLDFRFSSRLLETLIGGLYERATSKMVTAFRGRAVALYGEQSKLE